MDAFESIPPTAATWLRSSVLAPFVPAYWRHLTEQRYAPRTARAYLCCVAHFARWSRRRQLVLGGPGSRSQALRRRALGTLQLRAAGAAQPSPGSSGTEAPASGSGRLRRRDRRASCRSRRCGPASLQRASASGQRTGSKHLSSATEDRRCVGSQGCRGYADSRPATALHRPGARPRVARQRGRSRHGPSQLPSVPCFRRRSSQASPADDRLTSAVAPDSAAADVVALRG